MDDQTEAWAVHDLIRPILIETYGKSGMVDALIAHLSATIATGKIDRHRGREYTIMRACWDWFSGGTTATTTARKIEAALASRDSQGTETES